MFLVIFVVKDESDLKVMFLTQESSGFTIETTIDEVRELYGTLNFIHFNQVDACKEMLEVLIDRQIQKDYYEYFKDKYGFYPTTDVNGKLYIDVIKNILSDSDNKIITLFDYKKEFGI